MGCGWRYCEKVTLNSDLTAEFRGEWGPPPGAAMGGEGVLYIFALVEWLLYACIGERGVPAVRGFAPRSGVVVVLFILDRWAALR